MFNKRETDNNKNRLPVKVLIHSIDAFRVHWHKELELILVLKGSINVTKGEDVYNLNEGDLILINSYELHSTRGTIDENALVAVQIDPEFYNETFNGFSEYEFDCKFGISEIRNSTYKSIVSNIAKLVWELNKRDSGYEMKIGSYLYLIGENLLSGCTYKPIGENTTVTENDVIRLERIMSYVETNSHKSISLKDLAEMENLNYYYLSHFIKSKLGLSFQEYLNTIRLDKAVKLLLTTNESIINISNSTGFTNISSFNRFFKENYNLTPTEFKKEKDYLSLDKNAAEKSYLDIDRENVLVKLFSYLNKNSNQELTEIEPKLREDVLIDARKVGKPLVKNWQVLTTFSLASEGLRASWQKQLIELQNDIGYQHIRFHGIFMDDMMVYNKLNDGTVVYNWTYVNELFDFLLENNIKPFVDLTFMPDDLKEVDKTIFWWNGNISKPKDIELWTDLIKAFVNHCIYRYGIEEVNTWYIEVWNEPEFTDVFWSGDQADYFKFYKSTVDAIKSISKDIKVGGPSITHGSVLISHWLEDFLDYVNHNEVPIDFVSLHIFPEYIPTENLIKTQELIKTGASQLELSSYLRKIYHGKHHLVDMMNNLNKTIEDHLDHKVELHISEYNASSQFGNLINDTVYVAAYVTRNAIQNIDKATSFGYWTFTDLMAEHKLGVSHFHGGFGLINKDGLKKAAYNAYELLSKLGEEVIEIGDDHIITKSEDTIQILAVNYTHFDDLFTAGDISHINNRDRYSIYQPASDIVINFNIKNLSGDYKVTRYSLNREFGSVYDAWNEMGAPENMNKDKIDYLRTKEKPKMVVEYISINGDYSHRLWVPAHGVEMIVMEKLNL